MIKCNDRRIYMRICCGGQTYPAVQSDQERQHHDPRQPISQDAAPLPAASQQAKIIRIISPINFRFRIPRRGIHSKRYHIEYLVTRNMERDTGLCGFLHNGIEKWCQFEMWLVILCFACCRAVTPRMTSGSALCTLQSRSFTANRLACKSW